ncbi:hypothetical protein [Marinobacter sp.]|uniref:hypothetical protein n=1 Tax=Marinobacter sp. TaxID=50741 RepID=UPI0035C6EA66
MKFAVLAVALVVGVSGGVWAQSAASDSPSGASAARSGISLADLRQEKQTDEPTPPPAFSREGGVSFGRESEAEGRIRLSDVPAHRERYQLDLALAELARQQEALETFCHCSSERGGCYDNPYGPIKGDILRLEDQRLNQCNQVQQQVRRAPVSTLEQVQLTLVSLEQGRDVLTGFDDQAASLIDRAAADHRRQVAQANQRANDQDAFQWGKLTALGVGALAGGLAELETEQQVKILGAMVQDSAPGATGMGNMQSQTGAAPGSGTGSGAGTGSGNGTGAGNYSLACHLASQSICVEYTLASQGSYDQFLAECRQSGASIHAQCPVSGPACLMRAANRTAVTITPEQDPSTARQLCESGGGIYSLR